MYIGISRHPGFTCLTTAIHETFDLHQCTRCDHVTATKKDVPVNEQSEYVHFDGCNKVVDDKCAQLLIEYIASNPDEALALLPYHLMNEALNHAVKELEND